MQSAQYIEFHTYNYSILKVARNSEMKKRECTKSFRTESITKYMLTFGIAR
jgi:hypothetical protein